MKHLAALAALVAPLAFVTPADAAILWQPNYQAADPVAAGWRAMEAAAPDRLRLQGNNLRVEVKPGDRYTSGNGYVAQRSEVRGLLKTSATPASQWVLGEGTTRWVRERIYVPADFTLTTSNKPWLVATQFKGLKGGSPPNALEIKRHSWNLIAGHRRLNLTPVRRGTTVQFDIGIHFATTTTEGWVEAWVDEAQRIARTPAATLDTYWKNGTQLTDPVYLKNGIYQSTAWDAIPGGFTHILYMGAPLVTDTRPF